MVNDLVVKNDNIDTALVDLQKHQNFCTQLMKMPHYAKMGEVGIFAITQKAKSIGMDPLEALNGGMYFVNGKVELQSQAMIGLIRKHGHSVQLDPRSTKTNAIMHGRRADNGDTWTVSFSIDDAKRAGIYKNVWEKYPDAMCQWRCVSMLSRFLFSDVLKGCYIVGEIKECPELETAMCEEIQMAEEKQLEISQDQIFALEDILADCSPEYQENVKVRREKTFKTFDKMPLETYEILLKAAIRKREEYQKMLTLEPKDDDEQSQVAI